MEWIKKILTLSGEEQEQLNEAMSSHLLGDLPVDDYIAYFLKKKELKGSFNAMAVVYGHSIESDRFHDGFRLALYVRASV